MENASTPSFVKRVAEGGEISEIAEGGEILSYNPTLKPASRKLRSNMTAAEATLWEKLRKDQLGVRFYRQKPILNYIVDFYCPKAKLVIEVDGDYHNTPAQTEKDAIRDAQLQQLGLVVLRFSNEQVLTQLDSVLAQSARVIFLR